MPSYAIIGGKKCRVTCDRDLGQNYAVSVLSGQVDRSNALLPRADRPIVMKLHAASRWLALQTALTALKQQGLIDDFELEERPAGEAPSPASSS